MIISSKIDSYSQKILKYFLITLIIYVGGYCLIIPEWRYLWFVFILLMISSFFIVDKLHKKNLIPINIRNILLIFLLCSFIIQPAIEISYFANAEIYILQFK